MVPSGQPALAPVPGDWRSRGACRDEDPDLFFPITSQGPSARQVMLAKAVCGRCAVKAECLRFALDSKQDYGVWGGTTEEERTHMRRASHRARRLPVLATAAAG
jgi:WhiB family transcriptional regulator, redox-sensing transcriptional regulator